MGITAYRFNSDARYAAGAVGTSKEGLVVALTQSSIQVQSGGGRFQTRYPNMFEKYRLPHVSSGKLARTWNSTQMQFSQNQINFAVWCATAGCGVSAQDHLAAPDPLMQSLYYFHVYYQMRRILDELQAPCPRIERGAPSITHTTGGRTNRSVTSLGFRPTQTGAWGLPTTGWDGSTFTRPA